MVCHLTFYLLSQRERYGPCNPDSRNGSQQGIHLYLKRSYEQQKEHFITGNSNVDLLKYKKLYWSISKEKPYSFLPMQFHAEVYFDQDQQGYMLVDQGSQNGTVINGNRILQVCNHHSFIGGSTKIGRGNYWLFGPMCLLLKLKPENAWVTKAFTTFFWTLLAAA